jgi:hypothetical protein
MQAGMTSGAQSIMQPGFAGTDVQQVRQDIQRDLQDGAASQQSGQAGYTGGTQGGMQ